MTATREYGELEAAYALADGRAKARRRRRHDGLEAFEDMIGKPITRGVVDSLYWAADIIAAHEATIEALFELVEDSITLIDEYDPAAAARAARSLQTRHDAARARVLRAEGMSSAKIGVTMAREKGRGDPYDAAQVRRWLRNGGKK